MEIKELIQKLNEYNPNAKIFVIVNNYREDFSIAYGSKEGVTKADCDEVYFPVDRLCQDERE